MGVKDYLGCVAGGHRGLGIFFAAPPCTVGTCGQLPCLKKCAYALSDDVCPERTWARRMVEATMQSAFQKFVYHGLLEPAGRRISNGASDKGFAVQA